MLDLLPDVLSINHLSVNDVRLYPLFIFLVRNAEAVGHLNINHLICVTVIKTNTYVFKQLKSGFIRIQKIGHLEHLTVTYEESNT